MKSKLPLGQGGLGGRSTDAFETPITSYSSPELTETDGWGTSIERERFKRSATASSTGRFTSGSL